MTRILALLLTATTANASGFETPRVDPEPIAPVCTTFFGLPCHEGFRYLEPGGRDIPPSVQIRDFSDEIADWFDGPEQEEVCE